VLASIFSQMGGLSSFAETNLPVNQTQTPISNPVSEISAPTDSEVSKQKDQTTTIIDLGDKITASQITVNYLFAGQEQIDPAIKKAIELAVKKWTGTLPKDNVVSLVDLRIENTWVLGTLMYFDPKSSDTSQAESGADYVETIALIKKTPSNWFGAISNNSQYVTIVDQIPFKTNPVETRKQIKSANSQIHKAKNEFVSPTTTDSTASVTPTVAASAPSQMYYGYQLPWPTTDTYHLHGGWHACASGSAVNTCLDFGPDQTAGSSEILSVARGVVNNVCKVNGAAWIYITTENTSEQFQFIHLDANSVTNAKIKMGDMVDQGQLLGTVYNGATSSCGTSTGTHLHLKFPQVPIRIDGKEYTWGSIPAITSSQCPPRPVFDSTNPPSWIVDLSGQTNKTCTVKGTVTNWTNERGIGNITIATNTSLILSSDSDKCLSGEICTLENKNHSINTEFGFSFNRFKLLVNQGGKLYIENGAKIW